MAKKTDNLNLEAKLELRRYFLSKYHPEPPDVIDCCQGDGVIWKHLRSEFFVATYWGLDVKVKPGRLKLDSARALAQPGWPQNVVDIDTYGGPWKHWEAMLPNITRPTTVFLTRGYGGMMGVNLSAYEKQALGLGGLKVPRTIMSHIAEMAVSYVLTGVCDLVEIIEMMEATYVPSLGHPNSLANLSARYIGVRLEPKANGREAATPGRSEHPEPN